MAAVEIGPAAYTPRARRGGWRKRFPIFAYLCILPALVFAGVFLYFPSLSAIGHSFTDWDGSTAPNFIGLDNFRQIFSDPRMSLAFQNALKVMVFAVVVELTIPLAAAKMILALRSARLQNVFRVVFLLPLIVPQVVIYLLWIFIYNPDPSVGLLNGTLQALHLPGLQHGWLGDPSVALYAVMATGMGVVAVFPFVDGFGLLIYTAGLQAIPHEVLEAAQMDGAGSWARFFRIELPLILGQVRLLAVLTIVGSIQQYTAFLIMTDGGPAFVTTVPGLTMYHSAFEDGQMGYACAIGTLLFLIIAVLTVINLRFVRPATEYS
jgi:raffinose/stachyose/melibiose transport system permease protein